MPTLPADFTSQISSSTTSFTASIEGPAVLIIGVLLTAVVLEVIIHAIRGR